MTEFWQALREFPFLRQALLAGWMASIACGVIGSYVVTRRITSVVGSLAHAVLGGMGIAYWLHTARGVAWLQPLHGALAAAVAAALLLGLVRTHAREREDTVISALWAVGIATGVLFLSLSPGYKADLWTYLFGNLVLISGTDLVVLLVLDAVVLAAVLLFYDPLLAVSYDEEFALLRGLNVPLYSTLLLVLIALTIVSLVYVVGVVMVIALVTLPVSAAGVVARKLWQMMAGAALLSGLVTTGGLALSFRADLPTGAVTVLLAATIYLLAHAGRALLRRRLVGDHDNGNA